MVIRKVTDNLYGIYRACGLATTARYLVALFRSAPEIVKTRKLIPADKLMAGKSCRWKIQGVSITVDGRHFPAAREMYGRAVYFPDKRFDLRPGTVVVDLGCNAGLFSILAGKVGCRVVGLEAQKGFVDEARAFAEEQGISNLVSFENALIGADSGVLADESELRNASHFKGFVPPRIAMIELLRKHAITDIDFLKIDIEGSEYALFRDSLDWLGGVRRIAMETHGLFGDTEELVSSLRKHGFSVMRRTGMPARREEYLFAGRFQT
jgi:FkbM family methyltransferase